jgi:cyanate permease
MAIFFSAATAAGAFGGLLARAIMELDGARGIPAWSWIFMIEGAVTVAIGKSFFLCTISTRSSCSYLPVLHMLFADTRTALVAFWAMYDYADTADFLTEREREEIKTRLEADRLYLDDTFSIKYFWDAIADWKIYVHMLITFGIYSPLYSFSLFLPTIISKLGYSAGKAQLMTAPPYIVACFFCILINYLSDRQKQRGLYMIGCNLFA